MRLFIVSLILLICCEARYVPSSGIYAVPDRLPNYEGGMNNFHQSISLGLDTLSLTESGILTFSFLVTVDGKMDSILVVRGASENDLPEILPVLHAVSGTWTPGIQNGQPVPVRLSYQIAIN